jgi:regulator of protease activity HflC (stomatin/prohibitin superfamily)
MQRVKIKSKTTFLIKDTHRGLLYLDGAFQRVLGAGRHDFTAPLMTRLFGRPVAVEVVMVDMRSRELVIKGQEILTADKVALRVSIVVQFGVNDPKAAMHAVENFEDRLYSDVQLAARRSLARMTLEEILTNRTRLSSEILEDVKETAAGYGVSIGRADVRDLSFPGNVQEVMNRVLTAERQSQAQLVEARTKSEVHRIEAETKAESARLEASARADAIRQEAAARAVATETAVNAETLALERRRSNAQAYAEHPALLRLEELATLRQLAGNANARLYLSLPADGAKAPPKTED